MKARSEEPLSFARARLVRGTISVEETTETPTGVVFWVAGCRHGGAHKTLLRAETCGAEVLRRVAA